MATQEEEAVFVEATYLLGGECHTSGEVDLPMGDG